MSRKLDPAKMLRVRVLSLGSGGMELERVEALQVRLQDGSWLGVRPGHAPIIAATGDGELKFRQDERDQVILVKNGILTLIDDLVSILTTH